VLERPVSVVVLADRPDLMGEAGVLRWTEWGYDDPSPEECSFRRT